MINIEEILSIIEKADIDLPNDIIDLVFVEKCNNDYYTYYAEVDKEVKEKIREISLERISNIKNLEQCLYNPSGYIDGEIEICNMEVLGDSYENLINELESEQHKLNNVGNPLDIHHYIFIFQHEGKRVLLFRRFTKLNKLRRGFFGMFKGNKLDKLDNNSVVGIDDDIDLIEYNNSIIVLNHVSLERIFNLQEEFLMEAKNTMEVIKKHDVIINFEEFEEDVLNNIPAVKRLTKIYESNRLPLFFNNFDKVVEVSKSFDLGITFNKEENRIIYEDKSQISEITLLMNDSYYKTLIGKEKGTDKLR